MVTGLIGNNARPTLHRLTDIFSVLKGTTDPHFTVLFLITYEDVLFMFHLIIIDSCTYLGAKINILFLFLFLFPPCRLICEHYATKQLLRKYYAFTYTYTIAYSQALIYTTE